MYEKALEMAEIIAKQGSVGNRKIKLIRVTPYFLGWLDAHCDKGTIMYSIYPKTLPLTFRGIPMRIDNTILVGQFEIDFE